MAIVELHFSPPLRVLAEEIAAIKLTLEDHKHDLASLVSLPTAPRVRQGRLCGAGETVVSRARERGLVRALGATQEGKLALWPIVARVLDQGSRLSAVRLAGAHAACDILGVERFDADDLYASYRSIF